MGKSGDDVIRQDRHRLNIVWVGRVVDSSCVRFLKKVGSLSLKLSFQTRDSIPELINFQPKGGVHAGGDHRRDRDHRGFGGGLADGDREYECSISADGW